MPPLPRDRWPDAILEALRASRAPLHCSEAEAVERLTGFLEKLHRAYAHPSFRWTPARLAKPTKSEARFIKRHRLRIVSPTRHAYLPEAHREALDTFLAMGGDMARLDGMLSNAVAMVSTASLRVTPHGGNVQPALRLASDLAAIIGLERTPERISASWRALIRKAEASENNGLEPPPRK